MSDDGSQLELLLPDYGLLELVLPGQQDLVYRVLANSGDVCTCLVHANDVDPESVPSEALILRLETTIEHLEAVAAMQSIAELAIPDLVPHLKELGSTVLGSGRKVQYLVTQYIGGCVVLETIWNNLSSTQQSDIMHQVIAAMTRLHNLDLDSADVQEHWAAAPKLSTKTSVLGSPSMGFFPDISALLVKLIANNASKKDTAPYNLTAAGTGVVFGTGDASSTKLTFSPEDLTQLEKSRKLCHNDLEPRNVLVRVRKQKQREAGTTKCEAPSTENMTTKDTTMEDLTTEGSSTGGMTAEDTTTEDTTAEDKTTRLLKLRPLKPRLLKPRSLKIRPLKTRLL